MIVTKYNRENQISHDLKCPDDLGATDNLKTLTRTTARMPPTHALFESASGYAIFEVKLTDDIALKSEAMQASLKDLSKFGKIVSLLSFSPYKSAAQALENANDISEGQLDLLPWIQPTHDL